MKTNFLDTHILRRGGLMFLAVAALWLSSCSKDSPDDTPAKLTLIGVKVPATIDTATGGLVTITGKGFMVGDQIVLEPSAGGAGHTGQVQGVTETSASFPMPEGVVSGKYKLTAVRGSQRKLLGSSTINILAGIPDKTGMNVKGRVSSGGTGVAGVVVSDGYQVVKTDQDGIYYMNSDKANGYVFISVPGGYEVAVSQTVPQFFKYLTQPAASVEQCDFILTARANDKYKVVVFTDVHLADRVSDRRQFQSGFQPEVIAFVRDTESAGVPVYGISLGDLSWDSYWYTNSYDLQNYMTDTRTLGFPIFNTPGNHDHDPQIVNDDFKASVPFREIVGPTYYSFNLGKVHYILLDNVEYSNPEGIDGTHTYNSKITAEKMAWLQKDLETVTKSTPIVVGMHVPLHSTPTLGSDGAPTMNYSGLSNGAELVKALEGYTDVNIISGHTHINFNVARSASLREHNIAAVCATWWWTGHTNYAGNHISRDGTPGGYKVFEIDGENLKWRFKGIREQDSYQFRTYDLNKCLVTADKYCPGVSAAEVKKYAGGYDVANNNNEVLINVFDWAENWTIEVEDLSANETLAVKRVNQKDPMHIISYNMKKLANSSALTFETSNTAHLFKVQAKSAVSSLRITVTDDFGNVYTENMTRPKELAVNIK